MNTQPQFNFAGPIDGPNDQAKREYLAILDGFTRSPKAARGRSPTEQLVSPAEHIQLALNAMEEEGRALRALLDAPVFLPAHRARAARAAREIERHGQIAQTFFAMVKERCGVKSRWHKAGDI